MGASLIEQLLGDQNLQEGDKGFRESTNLGIEAFVFDDEMINDLNLLLRSSLNQSASQELKDEWLVASSIASKSLEECLPLIWHPSNLVRFSLASFLSEQLLPALSNHEEGNDAKFKLELGDYFAFTNQCVEWYAHDLDYQHLNRIMHGCFLIQLTFRNTRVTS